VGTNTCSYGPASLPSASENAGCQKMKLRCLVSAVVCATVLNAMAVTAIAHPGATLLGFASSYPAPDGSTCVHRGIDVAVPAGSEFVAPVAGTVRFAGRVPGPHGGSVQAVTLETAAGTVSMLPLERLDVAKGESVAQGDSVGRVAEGGDPSSTASHVHLSLRHGDLYVDPSALLAAVAPPVDPEPEPQPEPVTNAEPAPQVAPTAVEPAVTPAPALANGVSLAPQAAAAPQATDAPAAADESPAGSDLRARVGAADGPSPIQSALPPAGAHTRASATGSVELDTGVALVTPSMKSVPSAAAAPARLDSWGTLADGFSATALRSVRAIARDGAPAAAGLGFVVAAVVYLLGRRSFERRLSVVSPVSDRLGTLLQQLRAGDTLRGLTSCSGHAAFTVPEPFSPREVTK
jgi:hypothetical protein